MMSTADTSTASKDERSADAPSLSRQWNSIDWKEAEKNVRHIQGRISKAYSEVVSLCKSPGNNGLSLA